MLLWELHLFPSLQATHATSTVTFATLSYFYEEFNELKRKKDSIRFCLQFI